MRQWTVQCDGFSSAGTEAACAVLLDRLINTRGTLVFRNSSCLFSPATACAVRVLLYSECKILRATLFSVVADGEVGCACTQCVLELCYDASDALCSLLSRGTYTQVYV